MKQLTLPIGSNPDVKLFCYLQDSNLLMGKHRQSSFARAVLTLASHMERESPWRWRFSLQATMPSYCIIQLA